MKYDKNILQLILFQTRNQEFWKKMGNSNINQINRDIFLLCFVYRLSKIYSTDTENLVSAL